MLLLVSQSDASTGDLTGACWRVAEKNFPGSELVGMSGGNMSEFNVSGYLIDRENTVHKFYCSFPYSHGKPKKFRSDVFASDKKNPVAFTRELVKKNRERANNFRKSRSSWSDELAEELKKIKED